MIGLSSVFLIIFICYHNINIFFLCFVCESLPNEQSFLPKKKKILAYDHHLYHVNDVTHTIDIEISYFKYSNHHHHQRRERRWNRRRRRRKKNYFFYTVWLVATHKLMGWRHSHHKLNSFIVWWFRCFCFLFSFWLERYLILHDFGIVKFHHLVLLTVIRYHIDNQFH